LQASKSQLWPHVCKVWGYDPGSVVRIHSAILHNDMLACSIARILLLQDPRPLPPDMDQAWQIYCDVWRPGKPRPHSWPEAWRLASEAVDSILEPNPNF
jgi:hypothetical protein